jgi:hypothetical protein
MARLKGKTAMRFRDFSIDWEHEQARCPQGYTGRNWTPTRRHNQKVIRIKFGYTACEGCPARAEVVLSQDREPSMCGGVRLISRLVAARQREQAEAFVEVYDQRAG